MSMRMELSDLPPKYRAQAEAQIAARSRAKAPTLEAVAAAAKKTGREFDSRGEYDYYMGMILPKVQRGEVVKVESHRRFTMLPEKEYGNVKLPAMHYVYSDPSLQKGWKTIARELRKTEITAQRWEKFALVVLGSMLDEVPMVEELLSRAYDARD